MVRGVAGGSVWAGDTAGWDVATGSAANWPSVSPLPAAGSISCHHWSGGSSRPEILLVPGMRGAGIAGRRVEAGLVGLAGAHGLGHLVVDFQDDALGAVFAVRGLVLALDDGEGVHDVVHVVAGDAVEVEVGGVQFAAQQEAALFVPAEGRAVVAAVLGEGRAGPRRCR